MIGDSVGKDSTVSAHYGFLRRIWHLRVRFVVFSYQVSWSSKTTASFVVVSGVARRNGRRFLFYPLLVREDLKQR
ncbi:hypothetical protein M5689_004608 [Euphorbia peplus]|nr:hypothetical protein M5689_004608 [Euphorbia peplus]